MRVEGQRRGCRDDQIVGRGEDGGCIWVGRMNRLSPGCGFGVGGKLMCWVRWKQSRRDRKSDVSGAVG